MVMELLPGLQLGEKYRDCLDCQAGAYQLVHHADIGWRCPVHGAVSLDLPALLLQGVEQAVALAKERNRYRDALRKIADGTCTGWAAEAVARKVLEEVS